MTDRRPPAKRIGLLAPDRMADLIEVASQLVRDHTQPNPDELLLTYEASYGDLGDGADPRGPEDPIRFVAAAGFTYKLATRRPRLAWKVGVSANVPYGAEPDVMIEAAADAYAALLKELGADLGPDALKAGR